MITEKQPKYNYLKINSLVYWITQMTDKSELGQIRAEWEKKKTTKLHSLAVQWGSH